MWLWSLGPVTPPQPGWVKLLGVRAPAVTLGLILQHTQRRCQWMVSAQSGHWNQFVRVATQQALGRGCQILHVASPGRWQCIVGTSLISVLGLGCIWNTKPQQYSMMLRSCKTTVADYLTSCELCKINLWGEINCYHKNTLTHLVLKAPMNRMSMTL